MSEVAQEPRDDVEILAPSGTVTVVIGDEEFVQKPLSFFGKIELFSVLSKAVDKAMEDGGISINELLEVPQSGNLEELGEADSFVKGIAKMVPYAEDLLQDLFCIALAIPTAERDEMVDFLKENMTDDQAFEVINNFVDQNWEVMRGFFSERIKPLLGKMSSQPTTSASSKPSKRTRARTASG